MLTQDDVVVDGTPTLGHTDDQRLQRNIFAHVAFVQKFCDDNHIAIDVLAPNVMLQAASAMVQTNLVAGGINYLLITHSNGEHTTQRNGVFDTYRIEASADSRAVVI